jgi:ATP-dependent DNA helicase RecG
LNYDAPELHVVGCEGAEPEKAGEEKVRPTRPTLLTEGRNAKIIMRAIKTDGYVTIANLCRKTRLSSSGVYKTLAALKAAFKIRRVGPARGGYWEVVE